MSEGSTAVDLGGPIKRCRSCGASIIWARTEHGRAMPVDAVPVADGNLVPVSGDEVRVLKRTDPPPAPGSPRYRSHFETCPDAKEHRRG